MTARTAGSARSGVTQRASPASAARTVTMTYDPMDTALGDDRIREQLGMTNAVPQEPPKSPPNGPQPYAWWSLADRVVECLEALTGLALDRWGQEKQEQHQCHSPFIGASVCIECGEPLPYADQVGGQASVLSQGDQEHQKGREADHHPPPGSVADDSPGRIGA